MLFKLSFKNIRKSMKDYAIYFFTLILGVAIFYIFNSMDGQVVMENVTGSKAEIMRMLTEMLSAVSVFVSFILGFLIIYASQFLIKRRKKEFGIYMTLGMGKRRISTILLLETILIGLISLTVGLGIGILLSQVMSVVVASMFEVNMEKFEFVFSEAATIKTIIYFLIMYIFVMIFNTISVGRCKLIDLIYAHRKSEKIKMKNLWLSIFIFVISCFILGYAYYDVALGGYENLTLSKLGIDIALGCLGTFLLFWSLSGLFLKIVMSIKKLYYKGLNTFVVRQISSKINTAVFSMTVISIMLFLTICVLMSGLSIRNTMTNQLKTNVPVDINIVDYDDDTVSSVKEFLVKHELNVKEDMKDIVEFKQYFIEDVTLNNDLDSKTKKELRKIYSQITLDTLDPVMSVSDYNKVAEVFNLDKVTLDKNEYVVLASFDKMVETRNKALEREHKIVINGITLTSKYDTVIKGDVMISGNPTNTGVIIVSDSVIDSLKGTDKIEDVTNNLLGNYSASNKEEKEIYEKEVQEKLSKLNDGQNFVVDYNTKIDIYNASIGLSAMVTFIGIYLGLIFLMSSAAILALKELSESTDNKDRYTILRRIGTDEAMINRALGLQTGIFFLLPLLVALIHSYFGMKFARNILMIFGKEEMLSSSLMVGLFLILIYGGYFLITYLSSKRIIKN